MGVRWLALGLFGALGMPASAAELMGRIDPSQSRADFSLRVVLVRKLEGRFDFIQGAVSHAVRPGRFDVEVKIASQSLSMKNEDHAVWARSAEFFDSERFPWIAFEARDAPDALLREGGDLEGLLSLRGVTRPASFRLMPAACARPGLDCAVEARGELRRSDFGMDARRWAVSDKVKLALRFRVRPPGDEPAS